MPRLRWGQVEYGTGWPKGACPLLFSKQTKIRAELANRKYLPFQIEFKNSESLTFDMITGAGVVVDDDCAAKTNGTPVPVKSKTSRK